MEWHRSCEKPSFVEIRKMDYEGGILMEVYSNETEPSFYLKLQIKFCPFCGKKL